jgi:hypothetical protein
LGNFKFSDELINLAEKQAGYKYIGRLEHDRSVEEFNLQGKSLLKLKEDSPMFISIKSIAASLGY